MSNPFFSSATDSWETPPEVFTKYDRRFHFDLDACATLENAKCARFYTKSDDGLTQPWCGVVWCNPPYGRTIHLWMKKAYDSYRAGATVVCLIPARTDTKWWRDFATKGEIEFLSGRLKFSGSKHSAPFPSAIVIFDPKKHHGDCAICGTQLKGRSDAKFCSVKCRMRAHRGYGLAVTNTNPTNQRQEKHNER
jgi:phage N-6-adenine-methyltransferase